MAHISGSISGIAPQADPAWEAEQAKRAKAKAEPMLGETLRQRRLVNGIVMLERMDKTVGEYIDKIRSLTEGGDYSTAQYLARQLQNHLEQANNLANLLAELDK